MGHEPNQAELDAIDDDLDDELEEPRVRPVRIVVGTAFALVGMVGVVAGWTALMSPTPHNTESEMAVVLAPLGMAIGGLVLLVCLIMLLAGAATAIPALLEARAVRRLAAARAAPGLAEARARYRA